MKLRWDVVIDKGLRHYDAILMWFFAIVLIMCVGWIMIGWSMTENISTFNERLSDIESDIQRHAVVPESLVGEFQQLLSKSENFVLNKDQFGRMLFVKYKVPEGVLLPPPPVEIVEKQEIIPEPGKPEFVLKKTIREPIPLLWLGELRNETGLVLFQMNTPSGTHFREIEGEIDGYRLLEIKEGKLKIEKLIDGKTFFLEYKKPSMKKELFAEIYIESENRPETVHVGSVIKGFTVVEITDETAALKNLDQGDMITLTLEVLDQEEDAESEL